MYLFLFTSVARCSLWCRSFACILFRAFRFCHCLLLNVRCCRFCNNSRASNFRPVGHPLRACVWTQNRSSWTQEARCKRRCTYASRLLWDCLIWGYCSPVKGYNICFVAHCTQQPVSLRPRVNYTHYNPAARKGWPGQPFSGHLLILRLVDSHERIFLATLSKRAISSGQLVSLHILSESGCLRVDRTIRHHGSVISKPAGQHLAASAYAWHAVQRHDVLSSQLWPSPYTVLRTKAINQ